MNTITQEHLTRARELIKEWRPKIRDRSGPVVNHAVCTVELSAYPLALKLSEGFQVAGRPPIGGEVLALVREP